jgi:hypothetical protein
MHPTRKITILRSFASWSDYLIERSPLRPSKNNWRSFPKQFEELTMRIRLGCFATLVAASLMICGCGGEEKKDPPPGTDTDTPTLDIDEGSISSPDEGGTDGEEGEDEG